MISSRAALWYREVSQRDNFVSTIISLMRGMIYYYSTFFRRSKKIFKREKIYEKEIRQA
jgi:hypothetical protein